MPTPGDMAEGNSSTSRSVERDESPVVKKRQLESKSKLDKQVTQMKFKGNQKQFELKVPLTPKNFFR